MDKYLSIITNFGCHYQCPECVVRNNGLKMPKTKEESSYGLLLSQIMCNENTITDGVNWVSVSGGGDPLFHWWEHQLWWAGFFQSCKTAGMKTELHTSYHCATFDSQVLMFPYGKFDRVVYHLHYPEDLDDIERVENEIVRVVFVVSDYMTENIIKDIADFVKSSPNIDELSFRQRVDENYNTTYYLHDFLKAGHKKDWWYIEQNDYNLYYHNGKVYTKYRDIFE